MYHALEEKGVLTTVIERLERHQLPRVFDIKEAVDHGSVLSDFDIFFLKAILNDTAQSAFFVDAHPEYQELFSRSVRLYNEVIKRALENETNARYLDA